MRIAVIGAGPTGLAAAYALSGRGAHVVVFESTSVSGGMARTVTVGEERIEAFYHHIFTSDEALVSLAEAIGLGDRLEWLPPRNALYSGERLYPFTTPGDLLRLGALPLMDRIRLGLFVLAARRARSWEHLEERTAREWAVETGGKRVYETIWKPLLASKFGDYADQVGATWLWNKTKLRGSTRGKGQGREILGYFRGSFGVLYDTLTARIRAAGGEVRLNTPVLTIRSLSATPQEEGMLLVRTPEGEEPFSKVLVTTAPAELARMAPQLPEGFREQLTDIPHQANLCALLELSRPLSPYYWITVADEEFPFVALIEHTNLLPPARYGSSVVYLSRYLSPSAPLFRADDETVAAVFLDGLSRLARTVERTSPGRMRWDPSFLKRIRIFRADSAQHVATRGYGKRIPPHRTPIPNLYLNCMAQIYPEDRGQNYAIEQGLRSPEILDFSGRSAP